MSNKRQKRTLNAPANLEEAEIVMSSYAQADARGEEITAKMDQQMAKIREKYSEQLTKIGEVKQEKFDELQQFAQMNPDLFNKKKSLDMQNGTIGTRTGTPKSKTLKGFTWEAVATLLKDHLPSHLKTTVVAMRDKLLSDRDDESLLEGNKLDVKTVAELYKKCGFEIIQDESFFIDLKKEEAAAL